MTLAEFLTRIANAIRTRKETSEPINALDFESQILTLGPKYNSMDITENGEYDVKDYKVAKVLVPTGDTAIGLIQRDVTEYNIPYGVTKVASYVFYDNDTIKKIEIPESVELIGDHAFDGCSALEMVELPNSLKSLGEYCFNGCNNLQTILLPDGLTNIGKYCFAQAFNANACVTITIPKNTTTIGAYAFSNSQIASVVILAPITEIPEHCFDGAQKLSNVTLPDSVTKIGMYAFQSCASLTDIPMMGAVTEIGDYAFVNCDGLIEITIPNTVKKIGTSAFNGCDKLKKVTLHEGITSIGIQAFYGTALAEVTIPRTVSVIEQYSFNAKIKTFFIPSTITEIKRLGLYCNVPGYNVIMESETPCIMSQAFNTSYLGKIYVPNGTSEVYKTASGWSSYADYIYEFNTVNFNIDVNVLNNENYLYSIDNGETWEQFTNSQFTIENAHVLRFNNANADQVILIGTTEGGSDIATIANAEATYATSGNTTIYVSLA